MAPHKPASAAIDGNFWLVAVARDCGSEHSLLGGVGNSYQRLRDNNGRDTRLGPFVASCPSAISSIACCWWNSELPIRYPPCGASSASVLTRSSTSSLGTMALPKQGARRLVCKRGPEHHPGR